MQDGTLIASDLCRHRFESSVSSDSQCLPSLPTLILTNAKAEIPVAIIDQTGSARYFLVSVSVPSGFSAMNFRVATVAETVGRTLAFRTSPTLWQAWLPTEFLSLTNPQASLQCQSLRKPQLLYRERSRLHRQRNQIGRAIKRFYAAKECESGYVFDHYIEQLAGLASVALPDDDSIT